MTALALTFLGAGSAIASPADESGCHIHQEFYPGPSDTRIENLSARRVHCGTQYSRHHTHTDEELFLEFLINGEIHTHGHRHHRYHRHHRHDGQNRDGCSFIVRPSGVSLECAF